MSKRSGSSPSVDPSTNVISRLPPPDGFLRRNQRINHRLKTRRITRPQIGQRRGDTGLEQQESHSGFDPNDRYKDVQVRALLIF